MSLLTRRVMTSSKVFRCCTAGLMLCATSLAQASGSGCTVLLCIAGNWQNISMCVPPVRQALRDVARGRPWPSCPDAAPSDSGISWTSETTCPAMYSQYDLDTGAWRGCSYSAVISVRVNGSPWSDMFLNPGIEGSSTRYHPPARAALGADLDPTFDNDLAAWLVKPLPDPGPCC